MKRDTKVKRKERHVDKCYCCGEETECGVCGVAIIISSIFLLLVSTGTILTFTSVLQVCTRSSQCTAGIGEIARCRGICLTDRLLSFCASDGDCMISDCNTATCGVDGKCVYVPLRDGMPCNDGDKCTGPDTCSSGICTGVKNSVPCSKCVEGVFLADLDLEGSVCSDGSMCTTHDKCSNGACVGQAVFCPTDVCKTAVCSPQTGCGLLNNDHVFQPDLCTHAKCENGVYSETFKNCFDGNPCTLDACYPLSGVCVHPASSESCLTTCQSDSDCSAIGTNVDYACWDGMCADVTGSEMIIRISHADIESASCPLANHSRLQLRFYMDTDIKNNIMYIPKSDSVQSIYPHMDVFDIENNYNFDGNAVRTHFSLRSPCKNMELACYPFVNGKYEFSVKRFACTSLDTAYCQNDVYRTTHVIAPLNVIDCPLYLTQTVTLAADLTVSQIGTRVNATLDAGELSAWITDAVFCIPKETAMKECILNSGSLDCPYRGCFGTPDVYLAEKVTLLSNSNYTGAVTVSNHYAVQFSRGYGNYAGNRCESVSVVDSLEFSVATFVSAYYSKIGVFDVMYDIPQCGSGGRRLASKVRKIGSFSIS